MRYRVLLIAEACNPEFVSVPLEGWSHARALAQACDAHVVTQIRNRDAMVRAGLIEGRDFTAIDSEALAKPAYQLASRLGVASGKAWTIATALATLTYPYFEHLVWERFGKRIVSHDFDVVHRLTPLSPTTPSLIAERCARAHVPFVLGPLNGGVPWPKEFERERRLEREWLSYLRDAYKLLPGSQATLRHAAAILLGSRDVWRQIPRSQRHKCFYVPENAIDPARFVRTRTRVATRPVRAIFVGRLVPYKGADMLLDAAAPLLQRGEMELTIIGQGPQMPLIKSIIAREKLESAVRLAGWTPHEELQNWLSESDIMPFPSVREFGGAVILEAMACGVVPIVVNYGGPGELVSDASGYRIPPGPRSRIVADFRERLEKICANPEILAAMSTAAQARVRRHFTWAAKASQVLEIYRWLKEPQSPRPRWTAPLED